MLRNIFHHSHIPYAYLIDIGSGSVGVGIVELHGEEKKPLIIYTHRERIRITKERTKEEFIRVLKEALLAATLELSSNGLKALRAHDKRGKIDSIRVTYASPWSEVVTRIIEVEREEPFKATGAFVDSLVKEALAQARVPVHENAIFDQTGLEVANREIVDIRLNGYPVSECVGQPGVLIRLAHLSELIPSEVRAVLRESEKHLLAHPTVSEHTFPFALASAVKRIFPHTPDFISLEVTGEATECAIVTDNIVYENFYSLFGTHSFERMLAERLNTIDDEVRSHIRDYVLHTTREEVTTAIDEVRAAFAAELTRLFGDIRERYPLPENIVTLGDGELREFYETIVEGVYRNIQTEAHINKIDVALTDSFVEYLEETIHDHSLAIIALFFHKKEQRHIKGE